MSEAMRIASVIVLVTLEACGPVPENLVTTDGFDGSRAFELVERQVAMGARFPGSPGHTAVQEFLTQEISRVGWVSESQSFVYRETSLTNIEAFQPEAVGPLILLGAHYDTRPIADRDPLRPMDPVPGANDGASGVAVLLEMARLLPETDSECDVRLVFFDGEDSGGLGGWEWAVGSRHYAAGLSRVPEAVVVVDMVGDADLALPVERNSTPKLVDEIWLVAEALGLPAFTREAGPSVLDDHTPFLERGWPAVDLIDFSYPYWHTTADTPDKVSADSLEQVGRALLAWLASRCG